MLLLLVGVACSRQPRQRPAPAPPGVAPASLGSALAAERELPCRIDSRPPGAELRRGEAGLGHTPLELRLGADDALEGYVLHQAGYLEARLDQRARVELGARCQLVFELVPESDPAAGVLAPVFR